MFDSGRWRVVLHQPSKLFIAGSNPAARSIQTMKGDKMDDIFDDFHDKDFYGEDFGDNNFDDDNSIEDYDDYSNESNDLSSEFDGDTDKNPVEDDHLLNGPRWQDWMILGPLTEDLAREEREKLKALRNLDKEKPQ